MASNDQSRHWRTPKASSGGGNCVAMSYETGHELAAIGDSKNMSGPKLSVDKTTLEAFVQAVKHGAIA